MIQVLSHFPGQKVTVYLEVLATNGVRIDSDTTPIVNKIIFPTLTLASGYPQDMIKLDTGLYYHQFNLPTGAVSIGSYLVDVSYTNPINNQLNNQLYQILVVSPYGNFSASAG